MTPSVSAMNRARKYETELMVLALAYGYILVRPQELDDIDVPRADETYLYLIGSRPRLTLDPLSAMYFEGEIRVTGYLPNRAERREFQVVIQHTFGEKYFLDCPYPYDQYAIRRFGASEPIASGVASNIAIAGARGVPQEAREFTVLYVGQAYGKKGERSSVQRLRNHGTLQRILADVAPDRQIWLALCRLDDLTLTGVMSGSGRAEVTGEADGEHHLRALRWLHSRGADRREAVSLAEACLIRYFRPAYNSQLKHSFPQPQHAVLTALAELDLNSVGMELQLQDLGILAGNEHVAMGNWHAQAFETHFDTSRGPLLESVATPSTTTVGYTI